MSDAEARSLEGAKDAPVGPRIQLSKNGTGADMSGSAPSAVARRKHHRKKDAESASAKPLSPLRQDATGTVTEAAPSTASVSDEAPSSSSACSSTDSTPFLPVATQDGAAPVVPDTKTPLLAQLPKDIAAVRSSSALPVSRTPDSTSGCPLPKAQQSSSMVCHSFFSVCLFSEFFGLLVCMFFLSFLHVCCIWIQRRVVCVQSRWCSCFCPHVAALGNMDMMEDETRTVCPFDPESSVAIFVCNDCATPNLLL